MLQHSTGVPGKQPMSKIESDLDTMAIDAKSVENSEKQCGTVTGQQNNRPDFLPTAQEVLTARLENCLLDLGNSRDNVALTVAMLHMHRNLPSCLEGLPEVKETCHKELNKYR